MNVVAHPKVCIVALVDEDGAPIMVLPIAEWIQLSVANYRHRAGIEQPEQFGIWQKR